MVPPLFQTFLTESPSRCAITHLALYRAYPSVPTCLSLQIHGSYNEPTVFFHAFGKQLRRVFEHCPTVFPVSVRSIINGCFFCCLLLIPHIAGMHHVCVLAPTGHSLKNMCMPLLVSFIALQYALQKTCRHLHYKHYKG